MLIRGIFNMVSLKSVQARFETSFEVIEGGHGLFSAVISEAEQGKQPAYLFIAPRHVLRVRLPTAIRTGMVVRSPANDVYIIGDNGTSETNKGILWQSFRLFEAKRTARWERRVKTIDPVTRLLRDSHLEYIGEPWVAIEPLEREILDRKIHASIEQNRFISGADIRADDVLDGQPVTKSDLMLGVRVGILS